MIPKLIALSGPLAGNSFTLEGKSTTIGRESGSDILLEAAWISRQHCRVDKVDGGFRVVDLDSHNGTNVNGVPINERLLRGGDQISLGGASFLFVHSEVETSGALKLELDDSPIPDRTTVQRARRGSGLDRADPPGGSTRDARRAHQARSELLLGGELPRSRRREEEELILDAISRSSGSITEAAKILALHPNYLHRLIRNLDLRDELKNN